MPISVRAVPYLSAEVRCAPQAAHLAPACADGDGLEILSSACNRASRGFAWRYSVRYHEDLSSCVLYSQLRSCSVPDGLTAEDVPGWHRRSDSDVSELIRKLQPRFAYHISHCVGLE